MINQIISMFFEVKMSFRPTKYDKIGCDGVYIKSIKKINDPAKRRKK